MLRVFSRYVLVQVAAYGIDLGGFLFLTGWASIAPLSANVMSKLAAGAFAFIAHRRFTFSAAGKRDGFRQLLKFGLLLALNIPVSSALLLFLMPWITPPALAKFVADVACVGLSFLASRHLVFPTLSDEARRK